MVAREGLRFGAEENDDDDDASFLLGLDAFFFLSAGRKKFNI
jgi:hypothetical protein